MKTTGQKICLAAFICAFFLTSAPAQTGCEPPPPGIVSWWPAEGNANDVVSGNSGALSNGVTFAAGEVGQAFDFNGTSNQEIIVPEAPDLDLDQGFTIEAWVKFADLKSSHCIVCKGVVGFHQYCFITGDIGPQNQLELLTDNDGEYDGYDPLITSQANLVTNTWYHVAATANGTIACIYLDGQLLASASATGPYIADANALEIGAADQGSVAFFHGLIDEVSIYNRALSAAEIQAIYNAGSDGKCPPGTPEITAVSMAKTNVILTFLSGSNYMYGIQAESNLSSGNWSTIVSNIPGVVGLANYTNFGGATSPQMFYRAVRY